MIPWLVRDYRYNLQPSQLSKVSLQLHIARQKLLLKLGIQPTYLLITLKYLEHLKEEQYIYKMKFILVISPPSEDESVNELILIFLLLLLASANLSIFS